MADLWWLFVDRPDHNPFPINRRLRVVVGVLVVVHAMSWPLLFRARKVYHNFRALIIEQCR